MKTTHERSDLQGVRRGAGKADTSGGIPRGYGVRRFSWASQVRGKAGGPRTEHAPIWPARTTALVDATVCACQRRTSENGREQTSAWAGVSVAKERSGKRGQWEGARKMGAGSAEARS